jgi:hypothetical protein
VGALFENISGKAFSGIDRRALTYQLADHLLLSGRMNWHSHQAATKGNVRIKNKAEMTTTNGVMRVTLFGPNGEEYKAILKVFEGNELETEKRAIGVLQHYMPVAPYIGDSTIKDSNKKNLRYGMKIYVEGGDQGDADASRGSLRVFTGTIEDVLVNLHIDSNDIVRDLRREKIKVKEGDYSHAYRTRVGKVFGNFDRKHKKAYAGFKSLITALREKNRDPDVLCIGDFRNQNIGYHGDLLDVEGDGRVPGSGLGLRSRFFGMAQYFISIVTMANQGFSADRRDLIKNEFVNTYHTNFESKSEGVLDIDFLRVLFDYEIINNAMLKVGDQCGRILEGALGDRVLRAKKSMEVFLETIDYRISLRDKDEHSLRDLKNSFIAQIENNYNPHLKSIKDYVAGYESGNREDLSRISYAREEASEGRRFEAPFRSQAASDDNTPEEDRTTTRRDRTQRNRGPSQLSMAAPPLELLPYLHRRQEDGGRIDPMLFLLPLTPGRYTTRAAQHLFN